jgi:hypothetical protein
VFRINLTIQQGFFSRRFVLPGKCDTAGTGYTKSYLKAPGLYKRTGISPRRSNIYKNFIAKNGVLQKIIGNGYNDQIINFSVNNDKKIRTSDDKRAYL